MKYIIIMLVLLNSIVTKAQQINCDSLKKQFDEAITSAKAQKQDASIIQQLEATKKQLLEIYCKAGVTKQSQETAEVSTPKSTSKPTSTSSTANYAMAYTIDIYVESMGADGLVKTGYNYWLNAQGNKMLIDKDGIKKAMKFMQATEDGANNFDAWYIETTGKSIMYTRTEEGEKIALAQQLIEKLHVNKSHNLTIKATNQTKKIAGFDCISYSINGVDNRQTINLTCWVTKNVLPFYHNSFPMLSMFSAGAIGINGLPNRGVLLVQGKVGQDNLMIEVKSIKPMPKTFTLSGYKIMTF